MAWRMVPRWGDSDQQVAQWIHRLSDDQLQRLTFACLGVLYARGVVKERFSFTAPVHGLRFSVQVEPAAAPTRPE